MYSMRPSSTKDLPIVSQGGAISSGGARDGTGTPGVRRTNVWRILLEVLDDLLRIARRLKVRANASAVAAEESEDTILAIRNVVLKVQAHTGKAGGLESIEIPVEPRKPDDHVLRALAQHSPIESLAWSGTDGRRTRVIINRTEVTLSKRLDTILQLLHAQPSVDGFGGFIDYDALRKEIARREGRPLNPHSLSQSIGLLAGRLEASGLNRYWVDRDPEGRRVRLLIRKDR